MMINIYAAWLGILLGIVAGAIVFLDDGIEGVASA